MIRLAMMQRDECVVVMASKCVAVDVHDEADFAAARSCAVSEGGRRETKTLSKLTEIKPNCKHIWQPWLFYYLESSCVR